MQSSTHEIANTTGMASSLLDLTPEPESLIMPALELPDERSHHEPEEAAGEF
jgi:hypothetical protein